MLIICKAWRAGTSVAARLREGTFPGGSFHQFVIHAPKERIITAPCFGERVLHHVIMNVCEPVLDGWLISDTYACRVDKGRVAALQRVRHFAGRFTRFIKGLPSCEGKSLSDPAPTRRHR